MSGSLLTARLNAEGEINDEVQSMCCFLLYGGGLSRGHRTTFPGRAEVGPPCPRVACSTEPEPIEGLVCLRPHQRGWLLNGRWRSTGDRASIPRTALWDLVAPHVPVSNLTPPSFTDSEVGR